MIPAGRQTWTLAELAEALGLPFRGDGSTSLQDSADVGAAGPGQLAALYDKTRLSEAMDSRASVLVVSSEVADQLGERALLVSEAPKAAFARATALIRPQQAPRPGVHPSAVVSTRADLEAGVHVGPHVVIEAGCRIGRGSILGAGTVLMQNVEIGENVWVHPRVVIYPETRVGDRVAIFSGAVIGAPGFGHAHDEQGRAVRVPHLGRVVIEEDVEIGANTCVDRASFGETRIGARARFDNLVQVGHNAAVGADAMVAAQCGLSGSSRLGRGVLMGGQSGLADHVSVGDGSSVAAKTAVLQDVGPGEVVAGIPAQPISRWRRMVTIQGRLPEMWSAFRRLGREDRE